MTSQSISLTIHLSLAALISLIGLEACVQSSSRASDDKDKPTVTVSLAPHASLVSDIAGDRMKVVTLMPKGGDPETYDPTVNDIRRLTSSQLYLMAGNIEFERRVASQLPSNIHAVDLSEGIELLYGTHNHTHHDTTDRHHHEMADPHTWSSLRNGEIIVANIVKALSAADPDGAEYYSERGARLTERMDSLDAVYTSALARHKGRTFLIWHPSLSYIARDYGLRQQSLAQEHKEHSVKSLKELLDSASASSPMVLLLQPESDTPMARSTASSMGIPVEVINPLNPDWMQEMIHTLDALSSPIQ